MSRAPPFPTYRTHSPTRSSASSNPGTGTRPLQIVRPPSRSDNATNPYLSSSSQPSYSQPSNVYTSTVPQALQPARPQRSELRSRVSDWGSSDQTSASQDHQRDSVGTMYSDSSQRRQRLPSSARGSDATSRPSIQISSDALYRDGDRTIPTPTSVTDAIQQMSTRRYGATNGSDEYDVQRDRAAELEAERQRQQRIRDRAPGRRVNGKARAGDIDEVLNRVKDGWEFVIEPDFNSVDLALQLIDNPTSGKDMQSFQRTKNMLSTALKGSVDKHYQAFAASLPHHASLLNHFSATQTQILNARTSLQEAKDALGTKRADLVQLWARGQTLEEMMRLLDQIEHLKLVPDLLETLMSEKRLLQAAVLLIRSLKIMNKPDMLEIGAVSDLRSYLIGQETALREVLVDELQAHLYLTSFWCDTRWATYVPNQQAFPRAEFEDDPESKNGPNATLSATPTPHSRLFRFLNDLAIRPNDPPDDANDSTFSTNTTQNFTSFISSTRSNQASHYPANPESDSFAYLETLIESFAVLGKLGSALDAISQRLPSDIFSLVETTVSEVAERVEYGHRGSVYATNAELTRAEGAYVFIKDESNFSSQTPPAMRIGHVKASSLRLAALESSAKQIDLEILRDLFWTLFSKLDAVAQGLRVIYEVANRVGSRRDFKDASGSKPGALFPLSEIWDPIQIEVRTLIYDYLTDEEQGSAAGRNPISSINEILRANKFSRDRTKAVFRFVDTDSKLTNKRLKKHEDELTQMLKDIMPGLVSGSSELPIQALSNVGADDRLLGVGQHHRLLIRPDAFHVSVLFQPTLAFLDRISNVLPSVHESARLASSVLDDFVLKVYLPQLEEKVSTLFHEAMTGSDAFQPDPSSSRLSREPLARAGTQLMALINSLCAMLRTTPFHQESYTRLILGVIIQFYQRCSDRFLDLVTIAGQEGQESRVVLAAQWSQHPDLIPCLSDLLNAVDIHSTEHEKLCRRETEIELKLLDSRILEKVDLLPNTRNLASLAILHRTVSWFSTEVAQLKTLPDATFSLSPTHPFSPGNNEPLSSDTPSALQYPTWTPDDPIQLPLSREMSLRFQALLETFGQLSNLILDTIRIDIRCRTLFSLDAAFHEGNYTLASEAREPDSHILDLNVELGQCDDFAYSSLPEPERRFVFAGLGGFVEERLIRNCHLLKSPSAFGMKKMLRNVLALQQGLNALASDPRQTDFERVKKYLSLFFISPQDMLDGIRKETVFSFDEYRVMLNLQCGVDPDEGESGIAKATDRNYGMYMIELHGFELPP